MVCTLHRCENCDRRFDGTVNGHRCPRCGNEPVCTSDDHGRNYCR